MVSESVSRQVDEWISEEDLAVRPGLRVISRYDDLRMDDEEYEAWRDFISWHMRQEHLVLDSIPAEDYGDRFWAFEDDDSASFAFSSADFQRKHRFSGYHWKARKILERVKDLAILHSSISQAEGKENMRERFVEMVGRKLRVEAVSIVKDYHMAASAGRKEWLKRRLGRLNEAIRKCREVWQEHAFRE